jgi:hypothetical protein
MDEQDRYFKLGDPNRRCHQPQRPRLAYKNMSLITMSTKNRAALSLDDQAGASPPDPEFTLHWPLSSNLLYEALLDDAGSFLRKVKVSE